MASSVTSLDGLAGMASSVTSLASSVTSLDGLAGMASSVTALAAPTSSVTSLDGITGSGPPLHDLTELNLSTAASGILVKL